MKQCQFEECGREFYARRPNYPNGLCRSHYMKDWRATRLPDLRDYHRVENGHKVCQECGVNKRVEEFYQRPEGGPRHRCKECMRARERENYARATETAHRKADTKKVAEDATTIKGEAE